MDPRFLFPLLCQSLLQLVGFFVAWSAEYNLCSVSFVYAHVYLNKLYRISITVRSARGERAQSLELSGTAIGKQTTRLNVSNFGKYTAEIPTHPEMLSPFKHTNTHNDTNKLVCVRKRDAFMLRLQSTKKHTHTHTRILDWTSCHNTFSAATLHNHKITVITQTRLWKTLKFSETQL